MLVGVGVGVGMGMVVGMVVGVGVTVGVVRVCGGVLLCFCTKLTYAPIALIRGVFRLRCFSFFRVPFRHNGLSDL